MPAGAVSASGYIPNHVLILPDVIAPASIHKFNMMQLNLGRSRFEAPKPKSGDVK